MKVRRGNLQGSHDKCCINGTLYLLLYVVLLPWCSTNILILGRPTGAQRGSKQLGQESSVEQCLRLERSIANTMFNQHAELLWVYRVFKRGTYLDPRGPTRFDGKTGRPKCLSRISIESSERSDCTMNTGRTIITFLSGKNSEDWISSYANVSVSVGVGGRWDRDK